MVSAKFHIIGEQGPWLRIRVQEEIISHGLEGSAINADEKTLAVIIEGDKSRIKRLYSDITEVCPNGMQSTDLIFSLQKPTRKQRILDAEIPSKDRIMEYLREIEKKTTRMDQKLNKIIYALETCEIKPKPSQNIRKEKDENPKIKGGFENKELEVKEEAATGFAALFGD